MSRKVSRSSGPEISLSGKIGEVSVPVPAGVTGPLRRLWKNAVEIAKKFSKHLLKDRTSDFLSAVRKKIGSE